MTPFEAFQRYEAVRGRLPVVPRAGAVRAASDIGALTDLFDVFVFDAFGVLNVGETAIPGAVARVAALRGAGKRIFVLTNGATFTAAENHDKFAKLGFDFTDDEIVSSRSVCESQLGAYNGIALWGVAAKDGFDPKLLPIEAIRLGDDRAAYDRADGFLFLSADGWTNAHQERLADSLNRRPRPVVVANPDLVAPREAHFSLEPGFYAHALQDALPIKVDYFGKPFADVFEAVEERLAGSIDRQRICMVGDTLHTDVLGAQAAGWSTILVSEHGLYRGLDAEQLISTSGIAPDWIVPTI